MLHTILNQNLSIILVIEKQLQFPIRVHFAHTDFFQFLVSPSFTTISCMSKSTSERFAHNYYDKKTISFLKFLMGLKFKFFLMRISLTFF